MEELKVPNMPIVLDCTWRLESGDEEKYRLSLCQDGEVMESINLGSIHDESLITKANALVIQFNMHRQQRLVQRRQRLVRSGPVEVVPL